MTAARPLRLRVAVESSDNVVRAIHFLGDVVDMRVRTRPLGVSLPRLVEVIEVGWALFGRCNRRRPTELVTTQARFVTCRRCLAIIAAENRR